MKRILVIPIVLVPLFVAACGGGSSTVTVTTSEPTTTQTQPQTTTSEAAPTYTADAKKLLVPLASLPEGWTISEPESDAPEVQNSPRTIFYAGSRSRAKPLETGVESAAIRVYSSGSGLSTQVADHFVFVYDTADDATAARKALLGVMKTRPEVVWNVKRANPPKALEPPVRSWQGTTSSTESGIDGQVCVTIWQQANIVQAVYAGGLMTMPVDVCTMLAKTAFTRTSSNLG
jgi:hypothetical protein